MTQSHSQDISGRIRVGVAGWSYPDWEGIVYPPGEKNTRDRLHYLAGFVDVIEVNSTFYRPPERQVVEGWRRRVADVGDFRFTVKLWQRFTHSREDKWSPSEMQDFMGRVHPILEGESAGILLAQFPHSFHNTCENRDYLGNLLRAIGDVRVAVEVRHHSWNDPEAFAMLDALGGGICSIDQPMFRGSLKPLERVTGGIAYIRLHGRNHQHWFNEKSGRDERYDYLYSKEELAPWVKRTQKMAEESKEVYVIANNHFRGQALSTAVMLKSALTGRRVKVPSTMLEHFPALGECADPDAPVQGTLF